MQKEDPRALTTDQDDKAEVLAEVMEKHVDHGPKDAESPFDVPGLNMIHPIASYAPVIPEEEQHELLSPE